MRTSASSRLLSSLLLISLALVLFISAAQQVQARSAPSQPPLLVKKRRVAAAAAVPDHADGPLTNVTGLQERAISPRFPYGQKGSPVRGVNLGGWLVLEPFITPSIFQAASSDPSVRDEWNFGLKGYGGSRSQALAALKQHQSTWITESDFQQIASYGLNHVRIPIGYWAFGVNNGEPYLVADQWSLLKTAAGWAGKYGIKVMVDLHGVQSSQNGFDHSGHYGSIGWQYSQSSIDNTVNIIRTIADEFSQSQYANSVVSINVLNEPVNALNAVKTYYSRAYNVIRKRGNLFVVFDDGFQGPDYWKGVYPRNQYEGIALDSHVYTIFTDGEVMQNVDSRMKSYCSKKASYAARNVDSMVQILGEFSGAFTDCAFWLNGRNQGARYDGTLAGTKAYRGSCGPKTGPASTFSAGYKALLGRFHQIQRELGEAGAGWISWTWKTESGTAEDWSYIKAVQNGWIPQNLNTKLYSDTCSQYGY